MCAHSEQEIINVVADSAENNTLLKRDVVFARISFCLRSGTFKLHDGRSDSRELFFCRCTNCTSCDVANEYTKRSLLTLSSLLVNDVRLL